MITVNKANPTQGETTSSLTGSTGDGSGLHFDGIAGNIDIASPPDLGTKFSFEFVLKADSWESGQNFYLLDFGTGGRLLLVADSATSNNLALWDTDYRNFGVAVLDDLKVHHLVVTVDGTAATLYDNGNQVGTATLGATPTVDACTDAAIGSRFNGASGHVDATIYRARFYNRTLSSSDVRTAFERADVPVADQYGSQGSPYTSDFSSGTDSFSSYGGAAVAHSGSQINITSFGATGRGIYRSLTFSEPNKKYRVKLTGSVAAGTKNIGVGIASAGADDAANRITLTTTPTTHTIAVTYPSGSQINVASQDAVDTTVSITSLVIEQIGCVSDYDFAFANPTQSLTVQDRSTNNVDGTANSSTAVTQVQPIIQGNMRSLAVTTTSQAAGVPADGDIIVSGGVGVGAAAGAGGHGLTVDKSVADDWVAKIKNSGNTTPYGLQVDCQGSNAVTAFAVYAGSAPNNTAFTIKPTGVVVQGDGVKIGNSSAADTQLSVECDTTGEAIGDGIRVQNAHGVNNDIAPIYFGVHGGTRRAKAAIGLKRTGSYGIGELRFAVDSNGDDADVSFANDTKLTISSTGLATFSGGIALQTAPTNEDETASEAYTLDKYETGTWTCTLNGVTGGNTTAYYTRVGDIVTVWFYSGSMTSDGSAAHISGLPFNVSGAAYGGFFCFHNTYAPTANTGYFSVGTATGNFTAANATATASSVNATGRYIMFTGVYKAA